MWQTLLVQYENNPKSTIVYGCGILFLVYYVTGVVKRPRLICGNIRFKGFIQKNCPLLQQHYWPTIWCFESRMMTALAGILRQGSVKTQYSREILSTPDGGQVALDWYNYDMNQTADAPIAIFLPGLTGHSQSAYIRTLVEEAHSAGYRPAVLINRGIAGLELLNSKIYCAAETSDLRLVLDHLKHKYPSSNIVAAGISLGGILLTRYLVETGEKSLISAAMVISACFDLNEGAKSLEQPWFNLAFNKSLTSMCVQLVKDHQDILSEQQGVDFEKVIASRTLRQFDDHFTSKMFSFGSAANYYTEASLRGRLHSIKVPLLLLNAADDIFSPEYTLPCQEIMTSSHVAMVITSRGGHIAFMDGLIPNGHYFFERLYFEYVRGFVSIFQCQDKKSDQINFSKT